MDDAYTTFNTTERQRLIQKPAKDRISARRVLAMLASFGLLTSYAMQVNFDAGISTMTNWTHSELDGWEDRCSDPDKNNVTDKNHQPKEFDWDEDLDAFVQSSFFYGFILSPFPGGWVATSSGAKHVIGVSVLVAAVLNLLTPVATRITVYLLVVIRVVEGLCLGAIPPAVHALWGRWAPKYERATWTSFTYAGSMLGGAVIWAASGPLAEGKKDGWIWIYYIVGSVASLWFIVWTLVAHSTPADHPRISKKERKYIQESTGRTRNLPIPWRFILTSPPVMAICVCHVSGAWMLCLMIVYVPQYLKSIHDIDVQEPGWRLAIPYIALSLVMVVMGYLSDVVRSKGWMSTVNVRRTMTTIGLLAPASLLIASVYVGCDESWVMGLLVASFTLYGFLYGGVYVNHLDIAPRFAGVIMGLSSCLSVIPALVVPSFVECLADLSHSMRTWRTVFLVNGFLAFFACLIFLTLGAGEEQRWARPPDDGESKDRKRWNRRVAQWIVDSTDLG